MALINMVKLINSLKMNRVYNVLFENTLAVAGGSDGWMGKCPLQRREAKIKSILWSLRVYVAGIQNNLPLEMLDCLSYNLNIGDGLSVMGSPIQITSTPAGGVVSQNGIRFSLFKPGQYFF